ncbi:hypothetical protein [Streptomyces termitum]|uniref:hypothetical protein n=1 Tax=Streptomyces termitum TaxID=67368 RepID=UPI0037AD8A76
MPTARPLGLLDRLRRSVRTALAPAPAKFAGCHEKGNPSSRRHAFAGTGTLCGIPGHQVDVCRCLFVARRSRRSRRDCPVCRERARGVPRGD